MSNTTEYRTKLFVDITIKKLQEQIIEFEKQNNVQPIQVSAITEIKSKSKKQFINTEYTIAILYDITKAVKQ